MSKPIRRCVVSALVSNDPSSLGPTEYHLDCGHDWYGYPRVRPATVGIEIIHPKTARCRRCELERDALLGKESA